MIVKPCAVLPRYRQIQTDLRTRIESGELKPGSSVGSERELAKSYGVSLMTARHALVELEAEGLVDRRLGAGTFVAPPRIQFNKLVSFTQLMAGCGLAAHSRVLSARIVDHEREVCARLRLPATTKLVRVRRLRIGGGEPFALETCYLPAREFSGITEASLERRSLFDVLRRDYGLELSYADDEVDATSSDPRTAELLKVPPGAPILRLRQLLYSKSGAPAAYSLGLYRSDRHTVMVRRFA